MKQQLLDKFSAEKDKLPPDTRKKVLSHFPGFLQQFEEEIMLNDSLIWATFPSLLLLPLRKNLSLQLPLRSMKVKPYHPRHKNKQMI